MEFAIQYSHINSESLAQILTTIAEIQKFVYGIVFIGTPCTSQQRPNSFQRARQPKKLPCAVRDLYPHLIMVP